MTSIIVNKDLYEIRTSARLKGSYLWPKDDKGCWYHLNKKKYAMHPRKITDLCDKKSLILQAGGNCGVYPKYFAKHFDTVITVEPDPKNFYCLCHNVPEKNVFKFQAFLGKENTPMGIENTEDARGEYNAGGFHAVEGGNIPQLTIDSLGIEPDCIQLDIEGFEGNALLGAEKTIQRNKPLLVIETSSSLSEISGWTREEIDNLILGWGYEIIDKGRLDTIYKAKD